MRPSDATYLSGLRERSRAVLRAEIGETRDVALIDAPNQRNVGDSLIWAGEMAYLEQLGMRIRYVCDARSYDPLVMRRQMPSGVVLLHGGGNLGDLWLGHQRLRERVAQDLMDYRVVQLPQSIHFEDPTNARLANTHMGKHPDFRMLIRDTGSMDKAAMLLPDVSATFCYDMALGWEAPVVPAPADRGVVVIARADVEAASGLSEMDTETIYRHGALVTDWHVDEDRLRTWKSARRLANIYSYFAKARSMYAPWLPSGFRERTGLGLVDKINRINIASAVDLYSSRTGVVTDRLHAHVLAALMDRPHVVLDNSYGKVSTIFNDYTGFFSTAHYATSVAEAWQLYSDMEMV